METADGRYVIVYNGELYNDGEVRGALEAEGVEFSTCCDTETVLHAVWRWGAGAAARLRGMYAFGLWDRESRQLTLARDGFGMKPLYWAQARGDVVFGSEIPALLLHPGVRAEPDAVGVSAYLTTIRTTFEDRTMFAGIQTVRPGEWVGFDCSGSDGIVIERSRPSQPSSEFGELDLAGTIRDSVCAHLRSDVPWCSLLSGGLDSTILAKIARDSAGSLRTYVSGCPDAGEGLADDFGFADEAAAAIGSEHTRVPVDRAGFIEQWPRMVGRLGVPLSTPNEVAIFAVAERLRADGHVVALSGEGADELFGGYELPLVSALAWIRENPGVTAGEDGAAMLDSAAWLITTNKSLFLSPAFLEASGHDSELFASYSHGFEIGVEDAGAGVDAGDRDAVRLRASLSLQRRVNLAGLLGRLDSSMMLASVEGRTPFADSRVLLAADRIPMDGLFRAGESAGTKIALREAFAGEIPDSIAARPKRSFPLPFQGWLGDLSGVVERSGYLQEVYTAEAIAFVMADPEKHWNLAWPMYNLAIWAEAWL